jgi:hypothetical protein
MSKHSRSCSGDDDANLQYSIKRMKLESNGVNTTPYVVPITTSSVSRRSCPIATGYYEYDHRIMNELLHTLHDERIDRKQQKGSADIGAQSTTHSTMDVDH